MSQTIHSQEVVLSSVITGHGHSNCPMAMSGFVCRLGRDMDGFSCPVLIKQDNIKC